jgi:hypothetical protein
MWLLGTKVSPLVNVDALAIRVMSVFWHAIVPLPSVPTVMFLETGTIRFVFSEDVSTNSLRMVNR